ncbi:MAG: FAD/NAD(P)-binding protein [Halioglobus sp.]
MKKTDQELGMGRDITRRDLIHDAAIMTLGMGLLSGSVTAGNAKSKNPYYPPTRTGLRGSHPGAFESAHALAREGKPLPEPKDLDEEYDLVVVGAGISGLAAAHYYRAKYGDSARILILENHDDFGGHAKRNEFHQGGEMRLALGGTHNLEYWQFSNTVNALMDELGIDTTAMRRDMEFKYGRNGSNGPALWFDADTYGQNKLVTGCHFDEPDTKRMIENIEKFPISKTARGELTRFYAMRTNILEGKNEEQSRSYLEKTPYTDFLRQHGGLGDEAIQLFANANHGSWGVETRSLSVAECVYGGLPGLQLLGEDSANEGWDYPAAMFPDGNASLARLQVHALIPDVSPSANAGNIALAKFDYSRLDRAGAPRRLRLNSTVVNATNTDDGVTVTYINEGQSLRVNAKHCVMACYHVIIPHLCPDLPEAQKNAQKYQVKRPLLLTNVLIRSAEPMNKLGIAGADCPGRMHCSMFMFNGINTGGFEHKLADKGPVPLTFWGSISPPEGVVDLKAQMRASRTTMLALTFEDYEREVRTVLDAMLGPVGFDVQRDILAITVNRWPHGYSHDYLDLWDPDWPEGEAPHLIASKPFGNITMANSDAGADAYTHVAIDEAYRAVQELG